MTDHPEGTTHIYKASYRKQPDFFKYVGVDKNGYPAYVRWLKNKNAWAVTTQDNYDVTKYGKKV